METKQIPEAASKESQMKFTLATLTEEDARLRRPILEAASVAARLALDPGLLAQFPEGYRHLAYLQTRIGYEVKTDMPGLDGPEVAALYRRGESWLEGGELG